MTHTKDIYDLKVERLTKEPEEIYHDWNTETSLFKQVGKRVDCGCLTMIHRNRSFSHAYINGRRNIHLENAIKADVNIPDEGYDITPTHLPHFAKWQRRIDRMNAGESFEEVMKSTQ